MSTLADTVLPLIRTRRELHRWSAASAHGQLMHEAIDALEAGAETADPNELYTVTHKALASAITVIARADDSRGILGDACRRLLDLHPTYAAAANVPPGRLVDWMMKFQFHGDVDYFTLDPVAYAPALGDHGMATYRTRLAELEASLGPRPTDGKRWSSPHSHAWFTLDWNAKRLAVHDRDIDAIIRTHVRDRRVAAWFQDTAEAFEEIGEIELAIDWARQATEFGPGHQSLRAAEYWCQLLAAHGPAELLDARLEVFRRWPSSGTAAQLHRAAGDAWPGLHREVTATLARSPEDAVRFALSALDDVQLAWNLAHTLELDDDRTWNDLAAAYETIDPLAVLPVLARLVDTELVNTGAKHYRIAARLLSRMRKLAAGSERHEEVDELIANLREAHRRRPRLQTEFDRAGLP